MKWFKHETDAHTNLKLQAIMDKHGLEGYGFYWFILELVAREGEDFHILSTKSWRIYLKKFSGVPEKKINELLTFFAENNLIDKKSLKQNDLFIPKLGERSDDYTNRVRRKYVQGSDNVHLEEKRVEEKRKEYKRPEVLNKLLAGTQIGKPIS